MLGMSCLGDMNTSSRRKRWLQTLPILSGVVVYASSGLRHKSQFDASESRVRHTANERSCKKHYHMSCLKPALLAKPAKGYSWFCIPCSLQRIQDVEEQKYHFGTNGSAPKPVKAKVKERSIGSVQRPDVTYRGWPWRYFG